MAKTLLPRGALICRVWHRFASAVRLRARLGVAEIVLVPKAQLLGTYVNPKDELVESDPRIVKAVAAWTVCMREAGYDGYEDQDEIMDELGERLDQLLDGDDPATLTGDRLHALKRLQQEEVDASMADLACELKHTDDVYRGRWELG